MDRRSFLRTTAQGLTAAICGIHRVAQSAESKRPNIMLIMTDDQGYGDIGAHGNSMIRTPNLDAFAQESLEMTRFYVEPVCSPTRASLMTGRYHMRTGVYATSRGGARIFGDEVTVADLLARGGYRTGIFGKWHLGDNYPSRPQDKGFQETLIHLSGAIGGVPDRGPSYFEPILWHNGKAAARKGYCTDLFFNGAIDFITANRNRPFFAYIPTNVPHSPLEVADAYAKPFVDAGLPEKTAKIYGMIKNLDENFGRLMRALQSQGLEENTIVIFMTDNGPAGKRYNGGLRAGKGSVYEGGIRVPFYVRWPQRIQGKTQIDRIAAHIDLLPTLLSAAGLKTPKGSTLDGVDLTPLWTQQMLAKDWPKRTLFVQMNKRILQNRYHNTAVIGQRHKLVSYPSNRYDPEFARKFDKSKVELYDLSSDPGEAKDIAHQYPGVRDGLLAEYEDWFANMKGTRDFQTAPIHLGTENENPSRLSRYQEGQNLTGTGPVDGWLVKVTRTGRYQLKLQWPPHRGGALYIKWLGVEHHLPLEGNHFSAQLALNAGTGLLDVGFEDEQGRRLVDPWNNKTRGDVIVLRLDDRL